VILQVIMHSVSFIDARRLLCCDPLASRFYPSVTQDHPPNPTSPRERIKKTRKVIETLRVS
jgi:hypothetical protein